MTPPLPGEAFALLAAFTWACAMVLFKYSGERVPPLTLNLFKNAVAIPLLLLTILAAPATGPLLADETLANVLARPGRDIWILIASGVIGIAVADTLFFHGLNMVGVGITAIVDCLYTPAVFFFSWLLLHEPLTAEHFLGAALILSGVVLCSGAPPPPKTTRAQIVAGVLLLTLAMTAMAFGIVIAKPALEGFPLVWAATIRLAGGSVALAGVSFALPTRRAIWSVFRPSAAWRSSVPGAVLGTYLAYVFWVAGFKYADASRNAILNQTSIIFAMVLATLVVRERLGGRKLLAVILALAGVLVVLHRHVAAVLSIG